jgi:hypothetical protein
MHENEIHINMKNQNNNLLLFSNSEYVNNMPNKQNN